MSTYLIKYYRGNSCVSQFIGDDETMASAFYHLNYPMTDLFITKTNSEYKEYVLKFVNGGHSWVEVQLNNPQKEITHE